MQRAVDGLVMGGMAVERPLHRAEQLVADISAVSAFGERQCGRRSGAEGEHAILKQPTPPAGA